MIYVHVSYDNFFKFSLLTLILSLYSNVNNMATLAASAACGAAGAGAAGAAGIVIGAGLLNALAGASTGVQVGVAVGAMAAVAGSVTGGVTASSYMKGNNGVSRSFDSAGLNATNATNTTVLPTFAPVFVNPFTSGPMINALSSSPAPVPLNVALHTEDPTFPICDADPDYKLGFVSIFFEGIDHHFTDAQGRELQGKFEESYNDVSGGCNDVFQRFLQNATMIEQKVGQNNASESILETSWAAWVRCKNCPDEEPLFSSMGTRRRRAMDSNIPSDGMFANFLMRMDETLMDVKGLSVEVSI